MMLRSGDVRSQQESGRHLFGSRPSDFDHIGLLSPPVAARHANLNLHVSRQKMNRRNFITVVSGMTIWPLAAQGQQSAKVWRLGYVGTGGLGDKLFEAFTQK